MKSNKNKSAVWRAALAALLGMAVFFACTEEGHGKGKQDVDVQGSGRHGNSGGLSMEDYPYELGTFEGLDAETEWQILVDWFNENSKIMSYGSHFPIDVFSIAGYYGTYSGYIVVDTGISPKAPFALAIPAVVLDPVKLADWYIPQSIFIKGSAITLAWKNGQIYSLVELYINEELKIGDLHCIADLNPWWKPIEGQ